MIRALPIVAALLATSAIAGASNVIDARATSSGDAWRFDVTLRHADEGWDHYADAWRVVAPDGTVLGTRTLYHPHVNEQPFTRSLSGVAIPDGTPWVLIESHDSVHGWGGETIKLPIPD